MKALTFAGPGVLVLPGICILTAGATEIVHDDVAVAIERGCPGLKLTIEDAPEFEFDIPTVDVDESQPEAHLGEGQPTAVQQEEE